MLKWALVFLAISLVSGVVGFAELSGSAAGLAQILFYVFLVLFSCSFIISFTRKDNQFNK